MAESSVFLAAAPSGPNRAIVSWVAVAAGSAPPSSSRIVVEYLEQDHRGGVHKLSSCVGSRAFLDRSDYIRCGCFLPDATGSPPSEPTTTASSSNSRRHLLCTAGDSKVLTLFEIREATTTVSESGVVHPPRQVILPLLRVLLEASSSSITKRLHLMAPVPPSCATSAASGGGSSSAAVVVGDRFGDVFVVRFASNAEEPAAAAATSECGETAAVTSSPSVVTDDGASRDRVAAPCHVTHALQHFHVTTALAVGESRIVSCDRTGHVRVSRSPQHYDILDYLWTRPGPQVPVTACLVLSPVLIATGTVTGAVYVWRLHARTGAFAECVTLCPPSHDGSTAGHRGSAVVGFISCRASPVEGFVLAAFRDADGDGRVLAWGVVADASGVRVSPVAVAGEKGLSANPIVVAPVAAGEGNNMTAIILLRDGTFAALSRLDANSGALSVAQTQPLHVGAATEVDPFIAQRSAVTIGQPVDLAWRSTAVDPRHRAERGSAAGDDKVARPRSDDEDADD